MSADCSPEIRKRWQLQKQKCEIDTDTQTDGADSDNDLDVEELTKVLPQASDKTTEILDSALSSLQPRWRNGIIRGIFSVLMIGGFVLIIYLGPIAMLCTTLLVQVKCFQEIISVGYAVYRMHGLPWFRSLSWYFLITSNYFFYGESLANYFGILLSRVDIMQSLMAYHRFISFAFYMLGLVWFVLSLVKKYYMKQFSLFAWTHVALLIVVTQSYLILQNLFEGPIWFIVPVSMIICNDIAAYIFGFFFGKTPLIKLSPKKTWEGFVGGGICTVMFGAMFSHVFCHYDYFVCPFEYSEIQEFNCNRSYLFLPSEYHFPAFVGLFLDVVDLPGAVSLYPFVLHSLALSLFSSIIGPFGGFFASGFKRAFKVKDFGDIIPGHGGIMDRFDCQFLMATFVNVYIHSFIRAPDAQKLLHQMYAMELEDQVAIFHSLNETVLRKGLL